MIYSPLDLALQAAVPTVPVPLHGKFVGLQQSGHRFLIASDGLYIEIRRAWLHAVWPVALDSKVAKPFGKVEACVDLAFGRIPHWILGSFENDAIGSGNMEIAACVVWNAVERTLHYRPCESIRASSHRVEYRRPVLAADESLVIDLHSHGYGRAYFSGVDNEDDANEVKIAAVVGTVNAVPTWKFRLCLAGLFVDIAAPHPELHSPAEFGENHA